MNGYRLIDCDFYDRLESNATLRLICQIIYSNADAEVFEVKNQIVDVYAADKADYIRLNDGTKIRCDRLISVNGVPIQFADRSDFLHE
jgi:Rho-binding antiterminator